jgi:L-seryl-tRNA(Ser) seleniumtransferase
VEVFAVANIDDPSERSRALRRLPAVQSLLQDPHVLAATSLAVPALTSLIREALAREREALREGREEAAEDVVERLIAELRQLERSRLSPVLNATGIVVHTNLGRAPVSQETAAAMAAAASNAVSLELEPESNQRGGRMDEIASLMRVLTGAEATLVVNNNASAVLLVLSALAPGREVVLSRGEAVEIGGGFRIPDVLKQSGAELVEVGTTNRTYARDYAAVITDRTAILMKIHQSNFRIVGFTHHPALADIVSVADEHGVPVVDDQGSGLLLDVSRFGLSAEPTIGESIRTGASVVTASGDKLLGGPQAGIICGKAALVETIAKHPLARAVRADKTCLAGLAATLRHYLRDEAVDKIPVWRMLAADVELLRTRTEDIQLRLRAAGVSVSTRRTEVTPGGGSLPGESVPSMAIVIEGCDRVPGTEVLARRLRTGEPAIFGRIEDDQLLLDLRTVLPEQDEALIEGVLRAASG